MKLPCCQASVMWNICNRFALAQISCKAGKARGKPALPHPPCRAVVAGLLEIENAKKQESNDNDGRASRAPPNSQNASQTRLEVLHTRGPVAHRLVREPPHHTAAGCRPAAAHTPRILPIKQMTKQPGSPMS